MNALLERMRQGGLINDQASSTAVRLLSEGRPLEKALVESGVPEEDALRFLADEFGLPYVDLETKDPSRELLGRFPARILLKHNLLPLEELDGAVLVATSSPFDSAGLDELRLASGIETRPALAPSEEIARQIKRHLGVGADTVQSMVLDSAEAGIQVLQEDGEGAVDLSMAAEDASIIRFVNQVLTEAIDLRATDVHFEPFEGHLQVRYRVDGVLQEATIPPEVRRFQGAIVSRLKILSMLDIAEKRLPQDGRIKLLVAGREIDVRVSVIPMLHGEAVVLRLLDRSSALLGLEALGMSQDDTAAMAAILELPHGIVLVTGPTGSGKTTTLYAALSRINDIERKIITIEDPVEYHLEGINQIQVSTKAGLTFARGLRAILRHDPDVVLVGEIRDQETADIAVQASLTGHLVFSTLHTNDAPGALTRLVDMGMEPYLVASSLETVLAQRLVRVICRHCREPRDPADVDLLRTKLGAEVPDVLYYGKGCRECLGTGYRGRTAIIEMMVMNEEIRGLLLDRASAGEIRRAATRNGMRSLREDGWRHVCEGRTTVEEVLRVTKDEQLNGRAATMEQRAHEGET
jgi:type II secretion system protein E